jgi:DNA-binding transcriptional LysR family regulator
LFTCDTSRLANVVSRLEDHLLRGVTGLVIVDDADAMAEEAVKHHLGVAILPEWNAADGIRSGELENLLPDYSIGALPLHAVYPEMQLMKHAELLHRPGTPA